MDPVEAEMPSNVARYGRRNVVTAGSALVDLQGRAPSSLRFSTTRVLAEVFVLILFALGPAAAQTLTNGSTISGSIVVPDSEDTYFFSANAGEGFAVAVQETSGASFTARLVVYDPSSTRLSSSGVDQYFGHATTTGTYTVVVSDSGSDTGTYNLSFARAPGAAESGVLSAGQTVSGTLEAGDIDSFGFDLLEGEGFAVATQETDGASFSTRIVVYDHDGHRISSSGVDSYFGHAGAAGRYTALVFDNGLEQSGAYNFSFARARGASELGPLVNGGTISGTAVPGDIDSYHFDAVAGQDFIVAAQETSGAGFAARIAVYAPDGGRISASGVDSNAREAQLSGTFAVFVYDNALEEAGEYNVSLVRGPTTNTVGTLESGSMPSGSVVEGGVAVHDFGVSAGEIFSVAVSALSGDGFAPRIVVFDPAGDRLTASGVSSQSIAAGVTGIYTVAVFDNNFAEAGSYAISFDVTSQILSYAALGDSYSSGEGVWPYFDPTDGPWSGRHQSTRAYSTKLRVPGNPTPIASRADAEFDFLACTGAVTQQITADGDDCREFPPQLAPENRVDASRDLVTISVGGNDVQFGPILAYCMAHNHCHDLRPFDPHSSVELGELMYALALYTGYQQLQLFQEIKAATPNAPTVVFGYPLVMGGSECSAAAVPFATDAKISEDEQAWMRGLNAFVNDVTAQAAALAGVHFVSVEEVFDGHGVCGPLDDWIYGFMPHDVFASFHPTARGQQAYADAGNLYLESLRTGWEFGYHSTGLPRNPDPRILFPDIDLSQEPPATAPRFGTLDVAHESGLESCSDGRPVVVPGEDALVSGTGFAPGESVSIEILVDDQGYTPTGAFAADSNGDLQVTLTVPALVPAGLAGVIEARGAGASSGGLVLLGEIAVEAELASDTDGDLVPDACDNCPGVANAGQENDDLDAQGNVCDACPAEFVNDEDGDGLCASLDPCPLDAANDVDGDGACADADNCPLDSNPDQADADADGSGDECDDDDDGDGLTDAFEIAYGLDPLDPGDATLDSDSDNLDNLGEQAAGTDPNLFDTDGDGVGDGHEVAAGTDPLDDQSVPVVVPGVLLHPAASALLGLVIGSSGFLAAGRRAHRATARAPGSRPRSSSPAP